LAIYVPVWERTLLRPGTGALRACCVGLVIVPDALLRFANRK
jgi:hypothetical protein